MLQRKPVNRLGYNGINEIKEHPWLKYYPWKDLYEKKLDAPFMPKSLDNFDKRYCEGPDKIGNDTLERYQKSYPTEDHTGKLSFKINDITKISEGAYYVLGEYHLKREVGNADGIFMLVFKQINGAWKIIDTSPIV